MSRLKYTELTLHYSDAVDTVYPHQTERLIADDGTYEYFRPVEKNEAKDIMWRVKSAKGLIEKYQRNQKGKEYILRTLPQNYRLYEHIKGRKDEKSGGTISERRDTYLFGHSSGKRFRSPAEFLPHVLNLAAHDDKKKCGCWICVGAKHGNPPAIKKVPKREAEAAQAARVVAVEERQKEQETAGWVLRKGEVIWVWLSDNPEAEEDDNDALVDGDGGLWVAGVVAERPSFTPPFQKVRKATGNSFADIEMDDDPPPWHQEGESEVAVDKTYTVQLCAEPPKTGQVLSYVPQYHVRPWLSRREGTELPSSYSGKTEHPSIPQARRAVETFCLFDRVPKKASAPEPTSNTPKITYYQGAFIGAEKIYIHEPVRISSANDDEAEDVLVIDKIYTYTTISESPSKSDSKNITQTTIFFQGNVYTAYPDPICTPITPQQFAELPFRMRRGSGTGEIIKWFIRNHLDERGDCSLKMVFGRWYEPQVVKEWIGSTGFSGGISSTRDQALLQKDVKRWAANRAEALELVSLNGIDLKSEGEVKIQPAKLTMDDSMDVDTPTADRVTPERGFKSVNLRVSSTTPGINISPKKTPTQKPEEVIVEEDEDDDDNDNDDDDVVHHGYKQPGPEILSQSPTKRRGD